MTFDVEDLFLPFVVMALERLRYLYPAYSFTCEGNKISIAGPESSNQAGLRRELAYQLYRAKIYQDGLPLRNAMYEALLK